MVASYKKELLRVQDRTKEMILLGDLASELLGRVHARIDLASKLRLRLLERRDEIHQARTADDHEVDVTLGPLEGPSYRPVDKGNGDPLSKRRERLAKQFNDTGGLCDDSLKVLEEGVCLLGPEIDTIPVPSSGEDPSLGQSRQRLLEA